MVSCFSNLVLIVLIFNFFLSHFVKVIILFQFYPSAKTLFWFFMSILILIFLNFLCHFTKLNFLFNLTLQSNIKFISCFNFDLYFFNYYFFILLYNWNSFFNFTHSIFDWLRIGLHGFIHTGCFKSNDSSHEFKKLKWFF